MQTWLDVHKDEFLEDQRLLADRPRDHTEDFFDKINNKNLVFVLVPVFLALMLGNYIVTGLMWAMSGILM